MVKQCWVVLSKAYLHFLMHLVLKRCLVFKRASQLGLKGFSSFTKYLMSGLCF